jgi:RNA polymerase sigma factor (sigma-70 family)
MANMSYCAFENTYGDLNQCIALMWEEVEDGIELSQSEWEYAQMLVSKLEKLKGLVDEAEKIRTGDDTIRCRAAAEMAEKEAKKKTAGDTVARPDHALEERQLVDVVRDAIDTLEPEFRQLVLLRDVEDLAYEDIAKVTGLNVGTVKSRIHRGRTQLREKVERLMTVRGTASHLSPVQSSSTK